MTTETLVAVLLVLAQGGAMLALFYLGIDFGSINQRAGGTVKQARNLEDYRLVLSCVKWL